MTLRDEIKNPNADQVKMALEHCTSPDRDADCPFGCPWGDVGSCMQNLMYHALKLIKSQDDRIKEIVCKMRDRLKKCFDNEVEHMTMYTESYVLFVIDQISKEMLEGEA